MWPLSPQLDDMAAWMATPSSSLTDYAFERLSPPPLPRLLQPAVYALACDRTCGRARVKGCREPNIITWCHGFMIGLHEGLIWRCQKSFARVNEITVGPGHAKYGKLHALRAKAK